MTNEFRVLIYAAFSSANALIASVGSITEISFTPNFSCKNENTVPCDMPVASTIWRTLIHRSLKTISWILSIILGVVTSTGLLERYSSFVDVRPCLNSVT